MVNTTTLLYQSAPAQYSVASSLLAASPFLAPAGTQPRNPSPLIRSLSSTKDARACRSIHLEFLHLLSLKTPLLPLTASSLTCFSRHVSTFSPQPHSQQRKRFLFLSSYTITSTGVTFSFGLQALVKTPLPYPLSLVWPARVELLLVRNPTPRQSAQY